MHPRGTSNRQYVREHTPEAKRPGAMNAEQLHDVSNIAIPIEDFDDSGVCCDLHDLKLRLTVSFVHDMSDIVAIRKSDDDLG